MHYTLKIQNAHAASSWFKYGHKLMFSGQQLGRLYWCHFGYNVYLGFVCNLKSNQMNLRISNRTVGALGLSSVLLLIIALLIFGFTNREFSFIHDFISKLGAKGEPHAIWWNLIGFIMVGLFLFAFGLTYGILLKDKLLAFLLSLFGLGFALTSIPMDMQVSSSPVSKAHIVVISFGLAFWLFGLSRLGYNPQLEKRIRNRANVTAIALVISMIGFALGLWSMPITHRLVFGIVFGWTAITSLELIVNNSNSENANKKTAYNN